MNRADYARLKDIVAGALGLPPAERAAYVSARCGPDGALRVEAESLLSASVRAAPLYEDSTLLVTGRSPTVEALDHDHVEGVAPARRLTS